MSRYSGLKVASFSRPGSAYVVSCRSAALSRPATGQARCCLLSAVCYLLSAVFCLWSIVRNSPSEARAVSNAPFAVPLWLTMLATSTRHRPMPYVTIINALLLFPVGRAPVALRQCPARALGPARKRRRRSNYRRCCRLLSAVCCLLTTIYCLLSTVRYLLPAVYSICCLLSTRSRPSSQERYGDDYRKHVHAALPPPPSTQSLALPSSLHNRMHGLLWGLWNPSHFRNSNHHISHAGAK
jgi:hypothetical protein